MARFIQVVLVACLAIAAVTGQYPQETPEVAQAKAEHFRAYNAALAQASSSGQNNNNNNGQYQPQAYQQQQPQQQQQQYYQPQNPFQPNSDTAEVAQAKAEHFRLVNAALAQVGGNPSNHVQPQYQQQPAPYHPQQPAPYQAQQQFNGQTNADTAEVAQAKAEHFRAHQAAIARANEISRSDNSNNDNGQYQPQAYQQQQPQPQQQQYYQPQPNSLVNNGQYNPFQAQQQQQQPQPFYNPAAANGNRGGQVSVSQQNGGFTYNYATGN